MVLIIAINRPGFPGDQCSGQLTLHLGGHLFIFILNSRRAMSHSHASHRWALYFRASIGSISKDSDDQRTLIVAIEVMTLQYTHSLRPEPKKRGVNTVNMMCACMHMDSA